MTTLSFEPCTVIVAVSCWNRSRDTSTTITTAMMSSTTSCSCAPLTSSSLHHDMQPTPEDCSTSTDTSTFCRDLLNWLSCSIHYWSRYTQQRELLSEMAGLGASGPVGHSALTGVAVVMTLSTAVLAVCGDWLSPGGDSCLVLVSGVW